MQRTISVSGPDKDLLTAEEVATYLTIKVATLRKLVKAGLFPKPVAVTDKIHRWEWLDVVAYTHLRKRLQGA